MANRTTPGQIPLLEKSEEAIALSFEDAWESGGPPPALERFWQAGASTTLLLELVLIDAERRCATGQSISLETYVRRFPVLASDPWLGILQQANRRFAEWGTSLSCEPTATVSKPTALQGAGGGISADERSFTLHSQLIPLREHARGGLGEVVLAQEPRLGRNVALKRLQRRWANDASAVNDFLAEARITSQLEHPGIVPMHGMGRLSDGRPCYTMRFVEGATLRQAIEKLHQDSPLAFSPHNPQLRDLLNRFVTVCQTIAYAHSQQVVHRDLKPANIIIGPFGETLVLDWGMAKSLRHDAASATEANGQPTLDSSPDEATDGSVSSTDGPRHATEPGQLKGTPAYLSPEQAQGQLDQIGPASDIFGLGATLYAILTGKPPYQGSSLEEVLRQARAGVVIPPRVRNHRVSAALDAICCRALARLPQDRYASALDLAGDLGNWLADEPVSAWREPVHIRLRRTLRRHQSIAAVLAVLLMVVPFGVAISSWFISQAQAQARIDRETAAIKDQAANQISEYLTRIFETADPLGMETFGFRGKDASGTDRLARRLLERGAVLVNQHLHDQPLMRARLLDSMGTSFRSLGDLATAAPLVRDAYDVRLKCLGEGHADTATSIHNLARVEHERGDYASAERLYRQAIELRTRLLGEESLATADSKFFLAWMMFHQPLVGPVFDAKRLAEAERLLRESLSARRKHLPPDDRIIGFSLVALAAVATCQSGKEAAGAMYAAQAIDILRKNDTTIPLASCAIDYIKAEAALRASREEEAIKLFRKVLEQSREFLGKQHPLVVLQLGNLAGIHRRRKELDAAEQVVREALEIVRTLPLRSAPLAVDAMIEFGDYIAQRDRQEAAKLHREALGYARERPQENATRIVTLESRLQKAAP